MSFGQTFKFGSLSPPQPLEPQSMSLFQTSRTPMNSSPLFCNTEKDGELKSMSLSFQWSIKNFCVCQNVKRRLESSIYANHWSLVMYPGGNKEENKDFVSLYLKSHRDNVTATVRFSILNYKNNKVEQSKVSCTFKGREECGVPRFIVRSYLISAKDQLLVDDTLQILCEIYENESYELINDVDKEQRIKYFSRLREFDCFEKFFENGEGADIMFVIGDKQFCAHKAILMARSSVFEAMFAHDMKEKNDNSVEIKDTDPETFKELLRFIYAGKVNNIKTIAKDLLIAAEKYAVEGLKIMCEAVLIEGLNANNVIEYLNLADLNNSPSLKSQAITFVTNHLKDVVINPQFELFKDLDIDVIVELVRKMALKK